jgi:hypothetical protein
MLGHDCLADSSTAAMNSLLNEKWSRGRLSDADIRSAAASPAAERVTQADKLILFDIPAMVRKDG